MENNSTYPINDKLRKAIGSIFEDQAQGLGFLGVGKKVLPNSWYPSPEAKERPYMDRVRVLADKLEAWVSNLAAQTEEFDSHEDAVRIQSEARATLMALRDLFLAFPEAFVKEL